MDEFLKGMLPSIAVRDIQAIECLEKAHIENASAGLPIEFKLGRIFDAAWIWCVSRKIGLPNNSEWDKDFDEFCKQLMEPWPIEAFNNAGLRVRHTHTSNRNACHRYEISNT